MENKEEGRGGEGEGEGGRTNRHAVVFFGLFLVKMEGIMMSERSQKKRDKQLLLCLQH